MTNQKSYTTPELEAMEICIEQGFAATLEDAGDFGGITPGMGARIGFDYDDQQME